ncbi:protein of unknown function [Desulfovibrio sp. 86]|nr:protein of unknown function [Desulfovibrio sp. 86]
MGLDAHSRTITTALTVVTIFIIKEIAIPIYISLNQIFCGGSTSNPSAKSIGTPYGEFNFSKGFFLKNTLRIY